MKKLIHGEKIVLKYPYINLEEWTIYLKSSRCSLESTKNEVELIVDTEWSLPTPNQRVVITFSK